MTSCTTRKLRMKRKGLILPGMGVDLVIFDEKRILDVNTFEEPRIHPQGIDFVLVNGAVAVENGAHTGARAGRTIRD